MHLYRKALVSLVAVVALGAVSAGSASAAAWHVGGSELVGSANLAETVAKQKFTLTLSAVSIEIECEGIEAQEAQIAAPSSGQGKLVFSGCRAIKGGCQLEGKEIKTSVLDIAAQALAGGKEVLLTFKPSKSETFATFTLTGTCSFRGKQTIAGKAALRAPTGQEEKTEQEIVANTGAGELTDGGEELNMRGSAKFKLASGLTWSFH